jgi:NAD(P)-dependent dehydrogenase (short-subunit alcohol dehydrogenase family)
VGWEIGGKTVLVTGGNAGIGKATAIELSRAGAHLVLACRHRGRAVRAQAEIAQASGHGVDVVDLVDLDLADLGSVRAAAAAVRERYGALHVLVNNAGVASITRRRETADGFERHFGVNHLGHFALTVELLPLLAASSPARVVTVASSGFELCPKGLPWHDLQWTTRYNGWVAYGASKLANLYFTFELARRAAPLGISANVVHPGAVLTDLGRLRPEEQDEGDTPSSPSQAAALPVEMLTPEQGARGPVLLAASPAVDGVTGAYFDDHQQRVELAGIAADPAEADRLWKRSGELVESVRP